MTGIGKRIMERRKELEMTQEELALKMGYKSKSTINKIEMGINDIPQSKVVKFAEVLGTTPAILMGWEKVQKKNDILSDIILHLRSDDDFLSLVETLHSMDADKMQAVRQMLSALLK